MNLLIDLQYLPCIDYFIEIQKATVVHLEACENFQKQSYRNRCQLLSANKIEILTIPLCKANSKTPVKEIKIDYSQSWQNNHWRTIQSSYGKAPFYEYFSDYFSPIYGKKMDTLWEFNKTILTECLKLLSLDRIIIETNSYNTGNPNDVIEVTDKRSLIHPKKDILYKMESYNQVFGKEFAPNLSIIDLLFNEGPASLSYLSSNEK